MEPETVMSLMEALGDYYDEQPVLVRLDSGEVRHVHLSNTLTLGSPVLELGESYQGEE